jgi:AAA-like domain
VSSSLAPLGAVGNLRFTPSGVYAEYLMSGLPFIFLSEHWQDGVAAHHAELWRALPSGASISGLTVPVPVRSITRRMLHAHPDLRDTATATPPDIPAAARAWIRQCRTWDPVLTGHQPRRRIYWMSLPLDYGASGRTTTGTWRRLLEVARGHDNDSAASVAAYRQRAAQIVAALPGAFFVKPACVEQIWWHWNYTASRGVWHHPLPSSPYDPHARLPASAFTPVRLDPSAAALRRRGWRAARTDAEVFVRTYRDATDDTKDAYQAFLPLQDFPDTGIAWPKATIFKLLDDLTGPDTTLDWTIHATFSPADTAVATAQNTIVNIRDQFRQRGRHASSDDELIRKLASGKELASELKRGTAERGVNVAIVIAAAAADPDTLAAAAETVIRTYRRHSIGATRWRGSQPTLWRAFNPGTEHNASLGEFRNPTTTARFGKFVPLLASRLGNNTGVPLGMNVTSPGLRDVVLLDLLDAPLRDNPANLVIGGSPGRGKSQCAKNLAWSWLALGAGLHIFDPTDAREHERALTDFADKIVIDPARSTFSLDGLRIFPFEEAAQRTIDHLLPQLGFSALSPQAARLSAHLAPKSRHANGIGSTTALIGYLRDLRVGRVPADDDLLIRLEGLRTQPLLAPLFDDSLPAPNLLAQCVIWNFGGLQLPTVTEEYTAHLHRQTTPAQRAAQALFGLGAELSQSLFFARADRPDVLMVEECSAWTHSPGGQKCANKIIRQGRKAWTGFCAISQHPITDFAVLEDEFIDQRLCLGFTDAALAEATLRWCGRDLDRHPDLLRNYLDNTSPVQLIDHGDDEIDTRHGTVISGRHGEAWFLDEFGGFGKVRLFEAPTPQLAARFDTNPHRSGRWRQSAR